MRRLISPLPLPYDITTLPNPRPILTPSS
jgi:catechol 1,2-dioxygenase